MEHVSSARPTGKFPEKVENLKRWARFPGWNFRTEFRVQFTSFSYTHSLYQFQVHGRAPRLTGVYDQMEQLFINRKFHFCSHRNFRGFFLNGKRPLFSNFTRHQLITHTISICWWVDRALYRFNLFLVGTVLEQVEPVLVGTVPNRSAQGAGP